MTMPFQRSPAVEGVALDAQEVLFHQTTSKFVLVNPAARLLWEQLAMPRTAQQLATALCGRFPGATLVVAEQHATQLLEQLAARQFVTQMETAGTNALAAVPTAGAMPYHAPALRDVTEEEVLASFQMTAAEISAASCWWFSCATGCP